MSDPIIPPSPDGLRVTRPSRDVVDLLVGHACNTLEIAGEMADRGEAVATLVKTIRDTLGR